MDRHRSRISLGSPVLLPLVAALSTHLAAQRTEQTKPLEPALVENLTDQNFAAWRDHIRSTPDERDWAKLPWLMTFHDGLLAAAKAKKPLLLWTMNGHPFGCT